MKLLPGAISAPILKEFKENSEADGSVEVYWEALKRVLLTYLKKNKTIILKSLSNLEKRHPGDTNVSASNIGKYENRLTFLVLSRFCIQLCWQKSK